MKGRASETSHHRRRAGWWTLPASVVVIVFVLAICDPGLSLAGSRDDNCLSCHTPNELLPAGIPLREDVSDQLKWPVCPGMTRIRRAVALTESGLADLEVLAYQSGYRDGPEDQALMEAEARYRRLRDKPIVSQSSFADETEDLRRELNDRVLKPIETRAKKRRLLFGFVAVAGLAVIIAAVLLLVLTGMYRKKRAASEPKQSNSRN